MNKVMNRMINTVTNERFSKGYTVALALCYGMAFVCADASAQASVKQTAVSVFNILYSLIGALGGIALLGQLINMKIGNLLSIQDPKKKLVETLIVVIGAFSVVGIIQLAKTFASGSGADIGSV
jgi:uncharacterized membrane protein